MEAITTSFHFNGKVLLITSKDDHWKDYIFQDVFVDVIYVISPREHFGYYLNCVPCHVESSEVRKLLPESWKGKQGKDLADTLETGTCFSKSLLFCSDDRRFAGTTFIIEALQMAQWAIDN